MRLTPGTEDAALRRLAALRAGFRGAAFFAARFFAAFFFAAMVVWGLGRWRVGAPDGDVRMSQVPTDATREPGHRRTSISVSARLRAPCLTSYVRASNPRKAGRPLGCVRHG